MTFTTFGVIFLIGVVLGLRFKVLILVPAIFVVTGYVVGVGIAHGDRAATLILMVALVATALQCGYLFGVLVHAVIASVMERARKPVGGQAVAPRRGLING
jgi:hypothetical protein